MKSFRLLLALAAAAVLVGHVVHAGPAGPGHSHGEPEWAVLFGDASLPVVWQSATAAAEKINAALTAKKMDGIPDWAETVHLAAHALSDQVKLPNAEAKKRLDAALGQAAKIADEVLDGAQHNEAAKTAAAFKRMQSALTLAKTRLPKEITEAAPQTPRFATARKHDDHDHKH
jgi:hypothetical protein